MPGCRDSVTSDFCWAETCEPGSNISIATAPAQALHILFFIVHLLRVSLTLLGRCTNVLVYLKQVPLLERPVAPMAPPNTSSRRAAPRSTGGLDRDRQAAPPVFEPLPCVIISLELPPGPPLSRAALAGQLGDRSTPTRDAPIAPGA